MGGRGGGGAIASYLTDAHRAGREAAAPEVVRGDIARTRELIDGIDRRWTYTTGVISFAVEDAPTEDQQRAVMEDFERVAFAGMDPEQYDITWVRHSHTSGPEGEGGGRVELHFLTPRMELTTGKALNIAPPGWERTYAPLRDAWNHEQGWARPEDPERARAHRAAPERVERAQTREAIGAFLEERIAAGEVADRAGIVAALEEAGFTVPRQGRDYLTAADPETGARFRLKGRLYERDWTRGAELDRAAAREAAPGSGGDRGGDPERAAEARRELERVVEGRARRHEGGYGRAAGLDAGSDGADRAAAEALAAVDRAGLRDDRRSALRLAVDGDELGAVGSARASGADVERAGYATGLGGRDGRGADRDPGLGGGGDAAAGRERDAVPVRAGGGGDLRDPDPRDGGERERGGARLRAGPTSEPQAWYGVADHGPADGVRARALGRVRELGRRVREVGHSVGRYGRAAVASVAALLGADRGAAAEAERAGGALECHDRGLGRADAAHRELGRAGEAARERADALEREQERARDVERQEAADRERAARERGYGRGYGL